ncbi:hypothetical protein OH492_14805 [Vibrio chagasii]|nr:hypothetical protein [Vibrio chagasii]
MVRAKTFQYVVCLQNTRRFWSMDAKQSGRETQQNSSGGFEQDWLPPLSVIERVEVVRGPMSTLLRFRGRDWQ